MAARPSANATSQTAITSQRNRYENLPIAANNPITSVAGAACSGTAKDILERNERPRAITRAYSEGTKVEIRAPAFGRRCRGALRRGRRALSDQADRA